jgi:hypothetical protein
MAIQLFRITRHPTEFFAVGKVLVGISNTPNAKGGTAPHQARGTPEGDVYGTQIEILESGELRRRALERVRSMNPELREIEVEIRVTQTKGSSILNVAAMGEDGKYTRIFLSALLDEYVAFRQELIEKSLGTAMNKIIEEVLSREKQVKDFTEKLDRFTREKNLPLLESEVARLVAKVSLLRAKIEDLEHPQAAQASGAGAQVTGATLDSTREALRQAEEDLAKVSRQMTEFQSLKETLERAKQDYQDWKKALDRVDAAHVTSSDPVAIMERPVVAVETEPDLVWSLVGAGSVGGGIGFVLMLVCGLISQGRLSRREPPALPPQT